MKTRLDMNKIAKGLGAHRRGKAPASGGYFGAMQLAAEVETRFRCGGIDDPKDDLIADDPTVGLSSDRGRL